jgi:hypothetical protein
MAVNKYSTLIPNSSFSIFVIVAKEVALAEK